MRQIRKRAYAGSVAVLLAFGVLAHYSNQQTKHFEVDPSASSALPFFDSKESSKTQESTTLAIAADAQLAEESQENDSAEPSTDLKNDPVLEPMKTETFMLSASEFAVSPSKFVVFKNRKVNLIIKSDSRYSGRHGLEFKGAGIDSVQISSGQTRTVSFISEQNIEIEAYEALTGVKLPYTIKIEVK